MGMCDRRTRIVKEMLNSEKTYMNLLSVIQTIYAVPLRLAIINNRYIVKYICSMLVCNCTMNVEVVYKNMSIYVQVCLFGLFSPIVLSTDHNLIFADADILLHISRYEYLLHSVF